eukprot:11163006-Karenia_brevis.AAC.1
MSTAFTLSTIEVGVFTEADDCPSPTIGECILSKEIERIGSLAGTPADVDSLAEVTTSGDMHWEELCELDLPAGSEILADR